MWLPLGRETGALRASCGSIQQHVTGDYYGTFTKSEVNKLVWFHKTRDQWIDKQKANTPPKGTEMHFSLCSESFDVQV